MPATYTESLHVKLAPGSLARIDAAAKLRTASRGRTGRAPESARFWTVWTGRPGASANGRPHRERGTHQPRVGGCAECGGGVSGRVPAERPDGESGPVLWRRRLGRSR